MPGPVAPGHPDRGGPARARRGGAGGQGGRPGRGRLHRAPARPPPGPGPGPAHRRVLRRPRSGRLRGASPARRGPLRRHGDPHRQRRIARLPAARVPRRRQALPAVGPDRRAHALQRRRVADPQPPGRLGVAAHTGQGARRGARDRPGARRAVPAAPAHEGPRLRPRHAVAARARGLLRLHRDRRPAARRRGGEGATWSPTCPWTAWCAGTSGSARPRWRCGPCSRPSRTASRPRCSSPPRCWPSSTPRPSPSATPGTRCGSRCCRAFSPRPRRATWWPASPRGRSTWWSARTGCWRATSRSRTSACSWWTRSSASASATKRP